VARDIRGLDEAAVREHADALAQLLLDAHDAGMAVGLLAPLTRERAVAAWEEMGARLEPGTRVLLGCFDDGEVVGAVHFARADAENGRLRAEVQRLVVRGDRRGGGIGRALLDAIAERAREAGIRLLWLTTHAGTLSDDFYVRCGWRRLGELPSYSQRPDGELVPSALFVREL
jgi:GNAT superfamily N-acetyltransferase